MRCYLPLATEFLHLDIPVFCWDWLHLVFVLAAASDIRLNKASLFSSLPLSLCLWCWYSKRMHCWIPLQGWRQQSSYTVCCSCCPAKYVPVLILKDAEDLGPTAQNLCVDSQLKLCVYTKTEIYWHMHSFYQIRFLFCSKSQLLLLTSCTCLISPPS